MTYAGIAVILLFILSIILFFTGAVTLAFWVTALYLGLLVGMFVRTALNTPRS